MLHSLTGACTFGSPNIPTKTKFKKLSTIHGLMMWFAWSVIGLA
jgi:hypothetical protein